MQIVISVVKKTKKGQKYKNNRRETSLEGMFSMAVIYDEIYR